MSHTNNVEASVLQKWNNQSYFVRFIDKNRNNCSGQNLQWVILKDALEHFDTWECDIDFEMTSEELKLIHCDEWRKKLSFDSSNHVNHIQ